MFAFRSLILVSFTFGLAVWALAETPPPSELDDRVLLSEVEALTLHNGVNTAHRRLPAIPQLACVTGTAKGLYAIDILRCKNDGPSYDRRAIQWSCNADLPLEFRLGRIEVMCEGYESPDDPYVLKGSCGVEYELLLTEKGEEKYPIVKGHGWIFWVLVVGGIVILLMLLSRCGGGPYYSSRSDTPVYTSTYSVGYPAGTSESSTHESTGYGSTSYR